VPPPGRLARRRFIGVIRGIAQDLIATATASLANRLRSEAVIGVVVITLGVATIVTATRANRSGRRSVVGMELDSDEQGY
jgi:hypothetical protein